MKKLCKAELKMVIGGIEDLAIVGCRANATCADGSSISCEGYSVGSRGGCDGNDGGSVSCTERTENGFLVKYYSC